MDNIEIIKETIKDIQNLKEYINNMQNLKDPNSFILGFRLAIILNEINNIEENLSRIF